MHLIEAALEARKSKASSPKDCPYPSSVIFFSSISTLTLPRSIKKKLCPVSPCWNRYSPFFPYIQTICSQIIFISCYESPLKSWCSLRCSMQYLTCPSSSCSEIIVTFSRITSRTFVDFLRQSTVVNLPLLPSSLLPSFYSGENEQPIFAIL